MPAFERQSPYYLWDALPELFVRIDAIEPPPMDYEGLDHVRMACFTRLSPELRCRPSKSRSYRWAIITIDCTTAHIASLRPSLLASRSFPLGCGSNSLTTYRPRSFYQHGNSRQPNPVGCPARRAASQGAVRLLCRGRWYGRDQYR